MDQSKQIETKIGSTIFINPKFKAHINPNFLNSVKPPSTTNNIFINPKFISNLSTINGNQYDRPMSSEKCAPPPPQAKIIKQTSRNLIRQPVLNAGKSTQSSQSTERMNLIKIGKRKLVRPITQSNHDVKVSACDNLAKVSNIRSTYKIVNKSLNVYKIDRRRLKPVKDRTAKRIKYFNELITPTKVIVTDYKLRRIGNATSSKASESNLLNINGVLYKSSNTKLQKQSAASVDNKMRQFNRQTSNTSACSLYVRGEKFLLDPSGKKLERVSNNPISNTKNRIYLGGLTYIAKSNNTYERTNSHNTRLHLSVAKQKSINLLSKNLVKSNVSCLIYRKLGKCLGLQRGRCTKVHDRNQVAICQKFLKGACTDERCLLSHDTSLSKMPTCKFFLLGQCAKNDCPYLHKKVNNKTAICNDFLKGYCPKAEKCNLRHEFLCPNFESKDGCTVTRCPYVHKGKSVKPVIPAQRPTPTIIVTEPSTSTTSPNMDIKRYFVNNSQSSRYNQVANNGDSDQLNRVRATLSPLRSQANYVDPNTETSDGGSGSTESIDLCEKSDELKPFSQRKKLGILPSFIPID